MSGFNDFLLVHVLEPNAFVALRNDRAINDSLPLKGAGSFFVILGTVIKSMGAQR